MRGVVYILVNPVIPDLVKIGKTKDLERRVKDLSRQAGVPLPFEVFYACEVENADEAEKRIHDAFGDHRINPRKEFFRINPERVRSALKLAEIEDVTPRDDIVEDEQEGQALSKERNRRKPFRFSMVDVPVGSELSFIHDETVKAAVTDDRNVSFEGEATSLSQAALTVLNRDFGRSLSAVAGPNYWVFEGEALSERRIRMEAED